MTFVDNLVGAEEVVKKSSRCEDISLFLKKFTPKIKKIKKLYKDTMTLVISHVLFFISEIIIFILMFDGPFVCNSNFYKLFIHF